MLTFYLVIQCFNIISVAYQSLKEHRNVEHLPVLKPISFSPRHHDGNHQKNKKKIHMNKKKKYT